MSDIEAVKKALDWYTEASWQGVHTDALAEAARKYVTIMEERDAAIAKAVLMIETEEKGVSLTLSDFITRTGIQRLMTRADLVEVLRSEGGWIGETVAYPSGEQGVPVGVRSGRYLILRLPDSESGETGTNHQKGETK
jgi:hypothetical protein